MKEPAVTQSQNLPPWQWKYERAPVQTNPGPALMVSANSVDLAPCLEDGKDTVVTQTGCLQSQSAGLTPLAGSQPVMPQNQLDVLEDGKAGSTVESACLQNAQAELAPSAVTESIYREEAGLTLENVKMSKGLT